MKATVVFESPPVNKEAAISCWTDGEGILRHQSKAKPPASSNGFQNHLELRLGISPADTFSDTISVPLYHTNTHDGGGSGCGNGHSSCSRLASSQRDPLEELVLHQHKSIPAAAAGGGGGVELASSRYGCGNEDHHQFPCRDPPPPPNEAVFHQNKSSVHLGDQTRGMDGLCFDPQMPIGFIHPWSLAARQRKGAIEKAHWYHNQTSSSSSSPMSRVCGPPTLSLVAGWPPICAFRRNLDNTRRNMSEAIVSEDMIDKDAVKPSMFVKVNMEGYCIARKIDLKMHQNYDSLHHALLKLCRNFLSNDYLMESDQEENEADPDVVFLYEDYEGDKMLVGDVPWKLFINSVKRLYVVHRPTKSTADDDGSEAEDPDYKRIT